MYVWGNNSGQFLFPGYRSAPVQISTQSWSQIVAGASHSLGISNNLLYAWGYNNYGQLGTGNTTAVSSPVQIGTSSWLSVATTAVSPYALAIRSDGALFAWGYNASGQLGDGTTTNRSSPVQIGTSSWTQVATGGSITIGINNNGFIYSWGDSGATNSAAQINGKYSSPIQIGTSSWTQVSAGIGQSLAIRSEIGRAHV